MNIVYKSFLSLLVVTVWVGRGPPKPSPPANSCEAPQALKSLRHDIWPWASNQKHLPGQ